MQAECCLDQEHGPSSNAIAYRFLTEEQITSQARIFALLLTQIAKETTYLVETYLLPDGRSIRVGAERFMAPEALFTPDLIDKEGDGISDMIFKCIQVSNRLHFHLSQL